MTSDECNSLIAIGSNVLRLWLESGAMLKGELAAFWQSDQQICQRVFDRFCVERHFERDSEEARDLATILLILFQCGHTEEADLLGAASAAFYFSAPANPAAARGKALGGRTVSWMP
ncbi:MULTISPECIES: hypothetical protein [unclassified Mesorhizobium]|uniref:hypothetical protein n=1 Tax=unclassified Mesorhizobium TaxID=325217 RepID=UPI0012DCA764|nr:hypothetical protein [Mesorhizobium sp. L2C066B000]